MGEPRSLAEVIRDGRKRIGLTQDSMGEKVGCSRSLIASFERGTFPRLETLRKIAAEFVEADRLALFEIPEVQRILGGDESRLQEPGKDDAEDMIKLFMNLRRSGDVDLSGVWNAMWLTTNKGVENRNREIIHIRKRWNGSWQLQNEAVSDDNPDGGYLWIAKAELFDNNHLLGYYCARERAIRAKGTLCMELQPNGREIYGTWDGLNFDTMWASGLVALTKATSRHDPAETLDNFIRNKPNMPY